MRELVQTHDWSATPLGPMTEWPASLKVIVALMLDSTEPMVVWWGRESLQIYNDAYAPRVDSGDGVLALGRPAAQSWKHGWALLRPQVDLILAGQPSTGYVDFLVNIERDGRIEDTYWNYSLTPVRDDGGAIRGILLISSETTERILTRRRQQTLDFLRHELSSADTLDALGGRSRCGSSVQPGRFARCAADPASHGGRGGSLDATSCMCDGARGRRRCRPCHRLPALVESGAECSLPALSRTIHAAGGDCPPPHRQ